MEPGGVERLSDPGRIALFAGPRKLEGVRGVHGSVRSTARRSEDPCFAHPGLQQLLDERGGQRFINREVQGALGLVVAG